MKPGWVQKSLGDILRLEYGKPLDDSHRKADGAYPVYGANGAKHRTDLSYHDKPSIIVGRKGSAGELNLTEARFWPLDVTYFAVFDETQYDVLFLFHLLSTLELPKLARGVKPGINRNEVYAKVVNVPPLPEQQRIVRILDEAFASIAIAKANAEKNLQNARVVFDTYLQSALTFRGSGWLERRLGDVCEVERGSSPRPIKDYVTCQPDGVNWIRIGDTNKGEKYINSTAQKITPEGAKQSRYVYENDFVLTNSMSLGRSYIMRTTGCIHDGWFVLRLKTCLDLDYFYYLLSSGYVRSQFNDLAAGAIVQNISSELVKKATLPIPPLQEQKDLAQRFASLSYMVERFEAILRSKILALEVLKQTFLNESLAGHL